MNAYICTHVRTYVRRCIRLEYELVPGQLLAGRLHMGEGWGSQILFRDQCLNCAGRPQPRHFLYPTRKSRRKDAKQSQSYTSHVFKYMVMVWSVPGGDRGRPLCVQPPLARVPP